MADLLRISESKRNVTLHVIFVHGLGGDKVDTWQQKKNPETFWPKWLCEDFENLAVWTAGYSAAISRWQGKSMHLPDRAVNLLARILAEKSLSSGEIILIGHSLGGLVIKKMLLTADSMARTQSEAADLLHRVRGVAFLATPHYGSALANIGDRLRVLLRPSEATRGLIRNDPSLRDINSSYKEIFGTAGIQHLVLVETRPIRLLGIVVVEPDSGDPGLSVRSFPVDADHQSICRVDDRESEVYVLIKKFIMQVINDTQRNRELSREESIANLVIDGLEKGRNLQVEMGIEKGSDHIIDEVIRAQISQLRKSRFFPKFPLSERSLALAIVLESGEYKCGSGEVRSWALAWCARFLAFTKDIDEAKNIISVAEECGNAPEILVAKAFVESVVSDLDKALGMMATVESPAARSAAFMMVAYHNGAQEGLNWLRQTGLEFSDVDPEGKLSIMVRSLEVGDAQGCLNLVSGIDEEDYLEVPVLIQFAALAHLLSAVPTELHTAVHGGVPLSAKRFPLASNSAAMVARRRARDLYEQYGNAARELGFHEVSAIADDYALWLELTDPEMLESGLARLKSSMGDTNSALRRVNLALQFGVELDLEEIEQAIVRESTLTGGYSRDAAIARFSLVFAQASPDRAADYIDRHREQFLKHVAPEIVLSIEIEMLSGAGRVDKARERLTDLVDVEIGADERARLQIIVEEAEGTAPAEARKVQFENTGKLTDLSNLVIDLEERGDWHQLCDYGARLFERTGALPDLERLAKALAAAKRNDELPTLLRKHSDLVEQSTSLQMCWGWSLYWEGRVHESGVVLKQLQSKRDDPNDQELAINLAIASGAWGAVHAIVEEEWEKRSRSDAQSLIRTAKIAQIMGSGRTKDLLVSAAEKGSGDARILAAAYYIAINAGLEEGEEITQWLTKAADLSGEDGPIQKVSLAELVGARPEWERRETDTLEMLFKGISPMFMVAHNTNRSLAEMFLVVAIANCKEQDARRRTPIPAFSGSRQAGQSKRLRSIGLGPTALLTLGLLGQLERVVTDIDQIVIPHSTMGWMFEERQRISFHQPERIADAGRLRGLLATGALREYTASEQFDAKLATKIGDVLAAFISAAQPDGNDDERQHLVIKTFPVRRRGSLVNEPVDLGDLGGCMCSCSAIVHKLKSMGVLTAREENAATAYLAMHEEEWPEQSDISDNAVLYLDDLSVSYLQHLGLLSKISSAGLLVYISTRKVAEVNALMAYEGLTTEAITLIEEMRSVIERGIRTGKVKLGRIVESRDDEDSSLRSHPAYSVIGLADEVDAVISDDRFMNNHANFECGASAVPVLTSLDLLDGLQLDEDPDTRLDYEIRTKLRQSGFVFVPTAKNEILYHLDSASVENTDLIETAELKAIRENICIARMSTMLQLPQELTWLSGLMNGLSSALLAQWRADVEVPVAIARSNWIIGLLDLRGWAHRLDGNAGVQLVKSSYSKQLMMLLVAAAEIPGDFRQDYNRWLDAFILGETQDNSPRLYKELLENTRELVRKNPDTGAKEGA